MAILPWARVPTPTESAPKPFVLIRGCKGRAPLHVTFLGDTLWGAMIHYNPKTKRSRPCQSEPCSCGDDWTPALYKAYADAYDSRNRRHFIVELTASAATQVERFRLLKGGQLRGMRVILARKNGERCGEVLVELHSWADDPSSLPPSFDPVDHLERFWNISQAANNPAGGAEGEVSE